MSFWRNFHHWRHCYLPVYLPLTLVYVKPADALATDVPRASATYIYIYIYREREREREIYIDIGPISTTGAVHHGVLVGHLKSQIFREPTSQRLTFALRYWWNDSAETSQAYLFQSIYRIRIWFHWKKCMSKSPRNYVNWLNINRMPNAFLSNTIVTNILVKKLSKVVEYQQNSKRIFVKHNRNLTLTH